MRTRPTGRAAGATPSRKKRSRSTPAVDQSASSFGTEFAAPGDSVNDSSSDVAGAADASLAPPAAKRRKQQRGPVDRQVAATAAKSQANSRKKAGASKLNTTSKIKSNTKIQIGNLTRRWGKNVTEMKDSTSLFHEKRWHEIASRLGADGFVLIRGAIPREDCVRARERVFAYLDENGAIDSAKEDVMKGTIAKKNNVYEESFAIKAHCGAEASEREFDPKAWLELGNCKDLTSVYKSEHLYSLLRNILCTTDHWKKKTTRTGTPAGSKPSSGDDSSSGGEAKCSSSSGDEKSAAAEPTNLLGGDSDITLCPLTHQTWVRLMTHKGATIEHADYYYFKKDTQIFDRDSGYSAVDTGTLDESSQRTLIRPRFVSQNCAACGSSPAERAKQSSSSSSSSSSDNDAQGGDLNKCTLCGIRLHTRCLPDRLQKALSLKHFAAEGSWHCDKCAQSNFGVYTSWICVSDALTPSNSSLAMCPETHRLKGFNEPKFMTQVPRDFSAALRWQIPSKLNMGDVLLFNIKTIHAASVNVSKYFRFSMDTRFMLKCKHTGDLVQEVPSELTDAELMEE